MKIVNLLGGLGNQMFEYAMYLALKNEHPGEEIKHCTRSFRGYGLHNGIEIDKVFNLPIHEASVLDLCKVAYPFFNYLTWQIMSHWLYKRKSMTASYSNVRFDKSEISREDSVFYDGYWQNEKNFKHIRRQVLNTFSFPVFYDERNIKLAGQLLSHCSVSIHIRRGDYLKDPILCVCTQDYYQRAIDYIKRKDNIDFICVFSDDIPWCKEHLKEMAGKIDVEYVDWNTGSNSFRDMQLMTYCKHNIIANSSFSWWGAWLGDREHKIVITPKVWMNKEIINDPICESWIRL